MTLWQIRLAERDGMWGWCVLRRRWGLWRYVKSGAAYSLAEATHLAELAIAFTTKGPAS